MEGLLVASRLDQPKCAHLSSQAMPSRSFVRLQLVMEFKQSMNLWQKQCVFSRAPLGMTRAHHSQQPFLGDDLHFMLPAYKTHREGPVKGFIF